MKKFIADCLVFLGKSALFKNFVIGVLLKHPTLMDYIEVGTELYKKVKDSETSEDK